MIRIQAGVDHPMIGVSESRIAAITCGAAAAACVSTTTRPSPAP
jgi:hypothetical protein